MNRRERTHDAWAQLSYLPLLGPASVFSPLPGHHLAFGPTHRWYYPAGYTRTRLFLEY